MLTYTGQRNLFGDLVGSTDSTVLSLGDSLINSNTQRIINMRSWPFMRTTQAITTVAGTQSYALNGDVGKVHQVTITSGSFIYPLKETSEEQWNLLNINSNVTSTIPTNYRIFDGKIYTWPAPAGSNTLTVTYHKRYKPQTRVDYTTGTITSVANGGTAVVGDSTSWTSALEGRYLQITETDAANSGDGQFYEIESVDSATEITLANPYVGSSISGATGAYVIGQVSPLPDGYHELPVYQAVATYFRTYQPDARMIEYKNLADDLLTSLKQEWSNVSGNVTINDGMGSSKVENPNNYPFTIS